MTLVEIMVASGVMAVIALAMTSLMGNVNRSVQSTKINSDFESLVNQVQGTLNQNAACLTVMSPYTVSTAGSQNLTSAITSNGNATGTVIVPLPPGMYGSTLQISKLYFTKANLITGTTNQYLTSLYLEANKVIAGGAVGLQTVNHTFPLVVTLNGANKITGCSGSGSSNLWQLATNGIDIYYNGGNVGIGTSTPSYPLHVTTSSNLYGAYLVNSPTASIPSTTSLFGAYNTAIHGTSSTLSGKLYGSANEMLTTGGATGTLDQALGSVSEVIHAGPGTINNAFGAQMGVILSGSGNIGNAYELYLYGIQQTGTGVVTGNRYALYSGDANAPSYFAGNVGIGTSPSYGLHVLKSSPDGSQLAVDNGAGPAIWSQINFLKNGAAQSFISQDTSNNILVLGGQSSNATFDSVRIRPTGAASADAMTVKRSGNVGIGTSGPATQLEVAGNPLLGLGGGVIRFGTGGGRLYSQNPGNFGGKETVLTVDDGSGVSNDEVWIGPNTSGPAGNIQLVAQSIWMTGTAYLNGSALSSDERLKEDIAPLNGALDRVLRLEGKSFHWKDPKRGTGPQIGLIAQQVEQVYPEVVLTSPKGLKYVNYSGLIAPVIEALKSFYHQYLDKTGELEAKIASQQKEIDSLRAAVCRMNPQDAACAAN